MRSSPNARLRPCTWPMAACLAWLLFQPVIAMPQTESPDPLADAQRRKALAEAQAQALEAEKRALDAQTSLDAAKKQQAAAANPTGQDKALAEAKAAKDLADARKEAIEAQLAVDKARLGGVPDSGIAGKVELGDSAGKMDALLLAHAALRTAAGDIATAVMNKTGNYKRIYIYPATQVPNLQAVGSFGVQRTVVSEALAQASAAAQQALDAAAGVETTEAALATVGVALESITKLLSFFRSDFNVQGRDITLDDLALVQAVAGRLDGPAVHVPALFNPTVADGTGALVKTQMAPLSTQQQLARETADKLAALVARKQKQADEAATPAAQKRALEGELGRLRVLSEGLRTATAAYDTLLGRLMAPDEATAAMLRDNVVWDQLKDAESLLLVLKVQASGGSSYIVKNLWTSFGAMPYYVAGITVVSYSLLKGADGALLSGDVLPVHGGFHGVKSVPSTLKSSP